MGAFLSARYPCPFALEWGGNNLNGLSDSRDENGSHNLDLTGLLVPRSLDSCLPVGANDRFPNFFNCNDCTEVRARWHALSGTISDATHLKSARSPFTHRIKPAQREDYVQGYLARKKHPPPRTQQ